jgi:exodeoxyribonuclease VII small subunit
LVPAKANALSLTRGVPSDKYKQDAPPCAPRSDLASWAGGFLRWTGGVFSFSFDFVPNGTRNADQKNTANADALPFEEALGKLESIVEAMESEELPLESLLARYEEGTRLAKICQSKLAQAELKIQQLEKNAAGELTLKPLPETDKVE